MTKERKAGDRGLTRYEIHLIFWFFLIAAFSFFYGIDPSGNNMLVLGTDHLFSLPVYLTSAYITAYYLIPVYLLKRRYLLFIVFFTSLQYLCGIIELYKTAYLSMPLLFPEKTHQANTGIFSFTQAAFYVFLPTTIFNSVKYLFDWYRIHIISVDLERKHTRNELKLLKSQLHPSFLISSLSNLSAIAEKDPVSAAPGIEKISEILSFILYEFNHPEIPLTKEIQLIRNYISLEEMNTPEMVLDEVRIIGNPEKYYVPPLLFFTAAEFFFRCFGKPERESHVRILLEIQNHEIYFRSECLELPVRYVDAESEIIFRNLERRLKIIFPDNHSLRVRNVDQFFTVNLCVKSRHNE